MENTDRCGKCSSKVKEDNGLLCNGSCRLMFHFNCLEFSSKDFQNVKKIKGFKWFCENCLPNINFTMEMNRKFMEFKESIITEINNVKSILNGHDVKTDKTKNELSYAKAVAGEAVVIKPKTLQESSKTQEAIRKTLKPASLEVGITQVKNIKDGGVLIKCKSKEETEKVKKAAEKKLGKNYQIKIPEQKNPCFKILDIEENIDASELINCIKKQNTFLRHETLDLKVIAIKKMKVRYMAIVECDPTTYKRVLEEGSLCIGWSFSCRVFEYIKLFRCFKCGGFNHKAELCTSDVKCLNCGASDHEKKDCVSDPKCANCVSANQKLNLELNVNHSMFDNTCPVLHKRICSEKQKIKINEDNE